MNIEQKAEIIRLRRNGTGYNVIAKLVGMNENTVKSFCSRHGLRRADLDACRFQTETRVRYCQNCGARIMQTPGRKEKKFCSDSCRNKWWNNHLHLVKRKAMYDFICPGCGNEFFAYGNRNRKYCSHACYINDRFGSLSDGEWMAASSDM